MPVPDLDFDWDEENISHLARHEILRGEAESAFGNHPVIKEHQQVEGEDRWVAVAATSALRVIVLVFTVRSGKIRIFTGWDADRRTKREYFATRGGS